VRELDLAIFRAINGWPDWLEPVFLFFSEGNKWWPVRILLVGVLVFLIWKKSTRTPAILAMVAWPIANAATDWLKFGLQGARPSAELVDAIVRVERLTSFGTASAHSANMMAVATAFMFYNRTAGMVWLVVALLTGLSRIYVGVHYPYQVLFGWFVGFFVAFVAVMTWRSYLRLRQRRAAPDESLPADR
jgi:undecaprenyl-diphosphatase